MSKALIGSLQKFSIEDGPGIRTTIFFKGCPLSCKWCHNPELIDPAQQLMSTPNNCIGCGFCIESCPNEALAMSEEGIQIDRDKCHLCFKCAEGCYAKALRPVAKEMTVSEILDIAEEDRGFYENTGGGITLSGGEILTHAAFADELIDEAAKRDLNVCIDTCGFGDSGTLLNLASKPNVTNVLYDIKSIDDEVHKEYTGVSNVLILKNLRMLAQDPNVRDKIIIRMPLIKGVNDGDEIIARSAALYKELGLTKIDLLPYHPLGVGKMANIGGQQEEFETIDEDRISKIKRGFGIE